MATAWYVSILVNSKNSWIRHSFEERHNFVENKRSEGNENKIIRGDFDCTTDKMDKDGENKTQRLHIYGFNYTLSTFIGDNGLKDLRRRGNPDSSEFTYYDRCFGTKSRMRRFYTDIKFVNNTKINHTMVWLILEWSFTDHSNRFFSKNKIGNG